jgi:hypothetical protein
MQPHTPYLSEEAAKIRQKLSEQDVFFDRFHTKSEIQEAKSQGKIVVDSLMTATERGYVSLEKLEKLYKENLELVLCEVEGLVDTLDGKTVITADHGEHLGEGGEFAHPKGKYNRTLREVPWLELPFDDRRNVFEGEPVNETAVSQEGIDQQLEALGYR